MKTSLLSLILVSAFAIVLLAATFSYKCWKCGAIYTFDKMGTYKCPTDGSPLVMQPK